MDLKLIFLTHSVQNSSVPMHKCSCWTHFLRALANFFATLRDGGFQKGCLESELAIQAYGYDFLVYTQGLKMLMFHKFQIGHSNKIIF